jgi:hypothetical protein
MIGKPQQYGLNAVCDSLAVFLLPEEPCHPARLI